MAFVLDCSVTMAWVFPDEATDATDWLRDSLVEDRAFVPSLLASGGRQRATDCHATGPNPC